MPTALRVGPYRFFFYAGDGTEPIHMHVERDDDEAKFWLEPVRIERSKGFSRKELREIERIIVDQHALLVEKWNEYFGT